MKEGRGGPSFLSLSLYFCLPYPFPFMPAIQASEKKKKRERERKPDTTDHANLCIMLTTMPQV